MITVIIPTWNRSDDLRNALRSLTAQTTKDFQVLVSDDASTEDLRSVCAEFGDILNLTYIRAESNHGCGANRWLALEYFFKKIPTEYLMWLDSDDLLYPHAIERLEQIIKHNQADIIITNIRQESTDITPVRILAEDSRTWLHGKCYRAGFLKEHQLTFPTHLSTNEDLAFNLAVYAFDPDSYLIDEEVYYFRNNPNSVTKDIHKLQKCTSIDYIEAVYYAYQYFKTSKHELNGHMVKNILHLYDYYQRSVVFHLLTPEIKEHVRTMIRDPQISAVIVDIYHHREFQFGFEQWTVAGDTLSFFGQTFGAWVMSFFTQKEIQELIRQSGLQK